MAEAEMSLKKIFSKGTQNLDQLTFVVEGSAEIRGYKFNHNSVVCLLILENRQVAN